MIETMAPPDLTPREHEIMRLVCKGRAVKEIAHLLGISVHTARHQRDAAVSKLGSTSNEAASIYTALFLTGRRRRSRRDVVDQDTLGLA